MYYYKFHKISLRQLVTLFFCIESSLITNKGCMYTHTLMISQQPMCSKVQVWRILCAHSSKTNSVAKSINNWAVNAHEKLFVWTLCKFIRLEFTSIDPKKKNTNNYDPIDICSTKFYLNIPSKRVLFILYLVNFSTVLGKIPVKLF